MLKHLLLQSRMKYPVPGRVDTTIDCMLFFMLLKQVVATRLPVFMTILPTAFIIGYIVSLQRDWPDCGKENALDVPVVSPPHNRRNCVNIYYSHPENLVMIKTYGTDHYSLTIWKNSFLYICGLGNAKIFSTVWDSLFRDPVNNQLKPTRKNRKPLKKIPGMDERLLYRSFCGGRSSFSKSQQPYPHLSSQRRTTPGSLCCYPRKDRFLWSSRFKDWSTFDSGSLCFQHRNFSQFSLLSNQFYRQTCSSNFRPCQLSQVQGFKAFSTGASGSSYSGFFTFLFSRAQPNRTSLENYSTKGNSQSLLPKDRRSSGISYKPVCSMELS